MKKLLAACLVALMLCASLAMADEGIYGLMEVVNCKEWVSLRELPDTAARRLAEVPLKALVRNCIKVSEEFYYCEYDGLGGYIKADYLNVLVEGLLQEAYSGTISYSDLLSMGDVVLRDESDAVINVIATMDYSEGECLRVGGYRKDNTPVWGYTTLVRETAELPATAVFMAGTKELPLVMVYNSSLGLTALKRTDGAQHWVLSSSQCSLGAGICHGVAEDGTLYVAGYYGPDPVALSLSGEVLWQTSVGDDDIYWPYRIEVLQGCIRVCYDSCVEREDSHYEVVYGLDGALLTIGVTPGNHETKTN